MSPARDSIVCFHETYPPLLRAEHSPHDHALLGQSKKRSRGVVTQTNHPAALINSSATFTKSLFISEGFAYTVHLLCEVCDPRIAVVWTGYRNGEQ